MPHRRVASLHPTTALPPVTAEEAELRAWLRKFSTDRPRRGWRRAAKMARRAGWKVNTKRFRPLWRNELVPVQPHRSLFIDRDSPWQNAWIGSFNGRLRDELLNSWRFNSLLEARVIIEDWRLDSNANRPRSAHGELTPTEFALRWNQINQPQAA